MSDHEGKAGPTKPPRETIAIVVYGREPIQMPAVGAFHAGPLRPGVHELYLDHWDGACASVAADSVAFHAARASGLIGPVKTTKPPVEVTRTVLVAADSEEGKAELARRAAAAVPETTTVTIEIPDDPADDPPPKKAAKNKVAKKVARKG